MDAEFGTPTPILQNSECINITQIRATSAPNSRMPALDHRAAMRLTNSELKTTARACRALAFQERERAKGVDNPGDARAGRERGETSGGTGGEV